MWIAISLDLVSRHEFEDARLGVPVQTDGKEPNRMHIVDGLRHHNFDWARSPDFATLFETRESRPDASGNVPHGTRAAAPQQVVQAACREALAQRTAANTNADR